MNLIETILLYPKLYILFLALVIAIGIIIGLIWNPIPETYYRRAVESSKIETKS
ncbi:MAG: hypothetical protein ACLFPQ_03185 [Candidatus Woesearchaeota archaeon]